MPEPFKNLFNAELIDGMAKHFKKQASSFDEKGFVIAATHNLDALGLKERSDQITQAMYDYLPSDFEVAAKIILASLGRPLGDDLWPLVVDEQGLSGWVVTMPISYFIGIYGKQHFDLSMRLFKELTKRGTSEFGIRLFLLAYPEKTLATLNTWVGSDNYHVRRLISEGSRPRLPWGCALPAFKKSPLRVVQLLEQLRDDPEEYVRRSVANNLNDIAKDHPDLVADIAQQWSIDASEQRHKLIKHACRSLLKQGHEKTLRVMGYRSPKLKHIKLELKEGTVSFGNVLEFSLSILSDSTDSQVLMIDYIIHHKKANGSTSPKVFKWRTTTLSANQLFSASKKHGIKKITTRRYYAGQHKLELVVNGVSLAETDFQLIMPAA